jgi:hypothetical protein
MFVPFASFLLFRGSQLLVNRGPAGVTSTWLGASSHCFFVKKFSLIRGTMRRMPGEPNLWALELMRMLTFRSRAGSRASTGLFRAVTYIPALRPWG